MSNDEVATWLELQYLAIQELTEELEKFPTREEVSFRVEKFLEAGKPTLRVIQ